MNNFKLLLAIALTSSTMAWAQKATPSTTVNEDGTVTFRYHNDKAKQVFVDVQFAGKNAMKKDEKTGVWTATLGPAAPDMYPYCFQVDGVSIMDPLCEQYFPNEGFKNSLLEISGKEISLPHDIKDVPHGTMDYIRYYSESLGHTNNALVYLPPSYEPHNGKRYPVFYLISGTTDTEEVYYKVGRINYILDNLIAEGKAKEMIVVLPYGNPNKLLPAPPKNAMPMDGFGNDVFSNDLVNDLMPYVEKHYPTLNDRDHRAIGGFSRGGNQGLSNGLRNLDKFSYLCSYSSFTSTDIPEVYDNAETTNSKLHLFWLGVGTDDFLYGNARDYTEFLDNQGIRCVKEYTNDKFGHTWMNAKYFLDKTLRLLFNPEASQEAMSHAQPTLAKTGKELQFTPGVMARLFPKPIISPEYMGDGKEETNGKDEKEGQNERDGKISIIFRFNAKQAKSVKLESELWKKPLEMKMDKDSIWTLRLDHLSNATFKYCFVVDGLRVADPSNMYLSPDKGFKYSLCKALRKDDKTIKHGVVRYHYGENTAMYFPAESNNDMKQVELIPGKDDTIESWFKAGDAAEIADRLIAEGKIAPCLLKVTFDKPASKYVVRADKHKTWKERSQALVDVLTKP